MVLALVCFLVPCAVGAEPTEWREHLDAGWRACQDGKYDEARKLLDQAGTEAEQFEKDDPRRALTLASQAWLAAKTGQADGAQALSLRALAIYNLMKPEDADAARGLNILALLSLGRKQYPEAEALAQRSLHAQEQASGPEHPLLVPLLTNSANIYEAQGKFAAAEPLYQRALTIQEKTLGMERVELVPTLDRLGALNRSRGKLAEAETYYRRSLAICEKSAATAERVAQEISTLAGVCYAAGKDAEAEPLYRRALKLRTEALGEDHLEVARTMNNLAILCAKQGGDQKVEEAQQLLEKALAIRSNKLGAEDVQVATTLEDLAGVLTTAGKTDAALTDYRRALQIKEKKFGQDHIELATSLEGLADLEARKEKYADAEALLRRSVAVREKALGKTHRSLAAPLGALANLTRRVPASREEAEALFQRTLKIEERSSLGATAMARTLEDYAELLHDLKRDDEAKALRERAAEVRKGGSFKASPDVLRVE
jgi:tetratricopeptide (TPR) repeat protein